MYYLVLKGHSIKEFHQLTAEEKLFMQAIVEKDIEVKQQLADEMNNTTEKARG